MSTAFEVVASGYGFVEAPRLADDGTLYFSDLLGGGLFRKRPARAVETLLAGRTWIGGAVVDAGGSVICSGRGGLVAVAPDGAVRPLLSELGGTPVVAVNDIEADAAGGLYGGTIDFAAILERGEAPGPGMLFRIDPTGEVRILRDDVVASNGIAFSPDGETLYHCESTVGIWAWPLADGVAGAPPRLLAAADDCDGLVVDAEGCLWVAFWREAVLRRYRPDGSVERVVALPFPHLISLAFGGTDLRQLHIAVGADADHPGVGGIVRIAVNVPGLRPNQARIA